MSVRKVAWFLAMVTALSVLAGCLAPHAQQANASGSPLPFDPLTPADQERATVLALEDAGMRALLGSTRVRVAAVALHTDKAAIASNDFTRFADVQVYRYARDDVAWAVVDLTHERVASLTLQHFQPRLTHEETLEARDLIRADPLFKLAHVGEDVQILARLYDTTVLTHACHTHRCVEARLLLDGQPSADAPQYVDLSAMRLVSPAPEAL